MQQRLGGLQGLKGLQGRSGWQGRTCASKLIANVMAACKYSVKRPRSRSPKWPVIFSPAAAKSCNCSKCGVPTCWLVAQIAAFGKSGLMLMSCLHVSRYSHLHHSKGNICLLASY